VGCTRVKSAAAQAEIGQARARLLADAWRTVNQAATMLHCSLLVVSVRQFSLVLVLLMWRWRVSLRVQCVARPGLG
jgi:hypothetical protein